jgi:hypothetical protein
MKFNTQPFIFLLVITLLTYSCKSTRSLTDSRQTPIDTVKTISIVPDTVVLEQIVAEVQDSVELNVHRVLKDTLQIIGVGDIMMGTNFPNESYLPPAGGQHLLDDVSAILSSADVTFGNLEGVLLDEGGVQKYCKNPKLCYLFRSPNAYAANLKAAGFDVLSTANNHAGDFGNEGRTNTMNLLDSLGFHHAGQLSRPYTTFMIEGMKYGFAAFSPNTGTMSIHDIPNATAIIQHLDSIADVVIVSFHGGAEGNKYQHVTRKTETFYGENRGNVYRFAHALVDAGADIIFGHGPHVTRAVEVYKNRFIAYSLGNFCTYARFNLSGDNGLAPIINVQTSSNGKFLQAQVTPIIQFRPGGPKIDPQKRVIRKLQELTKKDFPEVPIRIDDNGVITYIQE